MELDLKNYTELCDTVLHQQVSYTFCDTGSNVSILQQGVSQCQIRESALKPFRVTGEPVSIKGQQLVSLVLGRKSVHPFLGCPLPTEAGLLGMDFFLTERARS
jgi:hypothetical protein